jgi:hypothetical protein
MKRRKRIIGAAGAALLIAGLAPAASASAAPRQDWSPFGFSFGSHAHFVEASSFSPGNRLQSVTVPLSSASVFTGDLYVAWVDEYDAPGQVQVSDNVNGKWTRGPSEKFSNGGGDIALYYMRPDFAWRGVTVTISASAPTFISGSVAHYRGMYFASLVSASMAELPLSAGSADADSGPTANVRGGDLVFGSLITGSVLPVAVALGSSQGRPLVQRSIDDSGSAVAADVLSANAGPQHAQFTLQNATDWYAMAAVFRSAY